MKKNYPRYYSVVLLTVFSFSMVGCGALVRGCARYGDDVVRYGDDVVKYGDDAVKYSDDAVKYSDDAVKYGDDAARYGDDAVKYGEHIGHAEDLASAVQGPTPTQKGEAFMKAHDALRHQYKDDALCAKAAAPGKPVYAVKLPDNNEVECLLAKDVNFVYGTTRHMFQGKNKYRFIIYMPATVEEAAKLYGTTAKEAGALMAFAKTIENAETGTTVDDVTGRANYTRNADIIPVVIYPKNLPSPDAALINQSANMIFCGSVAAEPVTGLLDVKGVLTAISQDGNAASLEAFYTAFIDSYSSYVSQKYKKRTLVYVGPAIAGHPTRMIPFYSAPVQ